jgi:hypothetical protein
MLMLDIRHNLTSNINNLSTVVKDPWHDSLCLHLAADMRRYKEQCDVYERANPGWKAFQAREAAARAARSAARTPPAPPPTAQEAHTEAW